MKFFKRIIAKILFWLDGVSGTALQNIFNLIGIFKRVIENPGLDILVELSKTDKDDKVLEFLRFNIIEFAKQFEKSGTEFLACRDIIVSDKRILCYLKTIISVSGKTTGEILRELFLWIADRQNINARPSHVEILNELAQ